MTSLHEVEDNGYGIDKIVTADQEDPTASSEIQDMDQEEIGITYHNQVTYGGVEPFGVLESGPKSGIDVILTGDYDQETIDALERVSDSEASIEQFREEGSFDESSEYVSEVSESLEDVFK